MKKPAILLIGPTGSGKTPLGEHIASHGLFNTRFTHFDFGELLRKTASGDWTCDLSTADRQKLQAILKSGALLEKENFYLAEHIISYFNKTTSAQAVLLNGLPRHRQQAEDVSPWFDIRLVVRLQCDANTVVERIQTNAGRDRTNRVDDQITLIEKKLNIFNSRTAPLCDWFATNGITVIEVSVGVETQPENVVTFIEQKMTDFVL